jgi:glycosyltransferase involved in cell wall biosynthesis
MRVVIDGRMILPYMSGIGRYLMGLCHGLEAIESDNCYELWLQKILPDNHPAWKLNGRQLKIRSLNIRHMSLRSQFQIPWLLSRENPDLYHYPHFDLPWNTRERIVITIHDLKYLAYPKFFPSTGLYKQLVIHMLLKHSCQRSSAVICVSHFTANDLHKRLGIPIEKLKVIPHGIDEKFFIRPAPEVLLNFRQRHRLERPFLLFVGERRPHKNIAGLLKSFELFIRQSKFKYDLVIAGRRYSDYQLPEKITEELGLIRRAHFIDTIPDKELPLLYQSADALVFLSFYEGFGFPILEAMASGIPVIASDRTALPEIAGNAAILVSPDNPQEAADAIQALISGASMRERYISEGLGRARQFSWHQCAQRTNQVYLEAVNK